MKHLDHASRLYTGGPNTLAQLFLVAALLCASGCMAVWRPMMDLGCMGAGWRSDPVQTVEQAERPKEEVLW